MALDKKPWVQALGIADKSFETWKDETPKGSSITFWCLKNQKINDDTYFEWAREHYALASLSPDFFSQPAPLEFWKQIQTVANWSAELLPLGEWDGTVFVGCVEPIPDTRWSFPVQYVLAPTAGLERFWNQLSGANPETPPAVIPAASLPTSLPKLPPEGIRMSFDASAPTPVVEKQIPTEMPEGLNLAGIKAYPTPPMTLPTDFKTQPHIVLGPDGLSVPGKELDVPPSMPSAASKKASNESPLEPHIRNVFSELNRTFQRSLFLRFQDKEFHVASQDGTWPAQEAPQEWHGLQEPSVFRIVSRTGLPYHGYVSSSTFNDEFFKLWGMPALPEHLTIVPIKLNGRVVAAFLCVGGKELNNEKVLRQTEKLVEKFSAYLNSTNTKAA